MKLSQIDKAIAALEAERNVIDYAIQKLKNQQSITAKAAKTRKPAAQRAAGESL